MKYYMVKNANGKVWYFPVKNLKTGMMLFQASSKNGKLLKLLFPLIHRISLFRTILKIEKVECPIDACVQNYINNLFVKKEHVDFSIFMGTPCKNQKITIQISKDKHILGYCKLTTAKEVFGLFKKEINVLAMLKTKGIQQIPDCIDSVLLPNGYYTFVQSTTKTLKSYSSSKLSVEHISFLKEVKCTTLQKVCYKNTDFYKIIHELAQHEGCFSQSENSLLRYLINKVDGYYGITVEFCFAHSDFTPWNTYIAKGKLYVFDFEYALSTCPPYMDAVHFVSQVGHIQKQMSGERLYSYILKNLSLIDNDVSDLKMLYLSYLLFIFSFYNRMFDWKFSKSDIGYKCWMEQLEILKNNLVR